MTAPTVPSRDGMEAVCAGCGAVVTFDCPAYVPVRFGRWVDMDRVDVDSGGHGETGTSCVDGDGHRPARQAAS